MTHTAHPPESAPPTLEGQLSFLFPPDNPWLDMRGYWCDLSCAAVIVASKVLETLAWGHPVVLDGFERP